MMDDRADVPCGSCRACCKGDMIMLLPADGDDLSTYEHEIVTVPGVGTGPILKKGPDGNCIYLGPQGCTIHDRAPKVCRVFDCRRWYLSNTRVERRRLIATGKAGKDILAAGRDRLASLKPRFQP